MTLAPGIHTLDERAYHQDPAPVSLSASIAHILLTQSPKHAWTAHPRLNPDYEPREEERFDVGKIAHRIILEGTEDGLVAVSAPDWRTKAAQEARAAARELGLTPLLHHHADAVRAMVAAARQQIAAHQADPPLLTDGKPEVCAVWEDRGVMCRARLDWLRDDHKAADDLKTTSRSANPTAYARALYQVGGDVQAAMYVRAVEALTGRAPEFRWIVVETSPPYALSVISPSESVLTIGRKKADYAIDLWRRCLERDEWPGFTNRVAYAELPPWEEARWLEREVNDLEAA